MNESNIPSPKQLLDTANGGKTPSMGQVMNHMNTAAAGGYQHFLQLFTWFVMYAVLIGLILWILGAVTNSPNIKKWGGGAVLVPLLALGVMYLIPTIVYGIKGVVLPN